MNDVVNSKRNSYQLTIVADTDKFLTFAGTDSNDSYDVDIFNYQSMQILFYKLSFSNSSLYQDVSHGFDMFYPVIHTTSTCLVTTSVRIVRVTTCAKSDP